MLRPWKERDFVLSAVLLLYVEYNYFTAPFFLKQIITKFDIDVHFYKPLFNEILCRYILQDRVLKRV